MNYERLLGVNIDHVATLRQARGTPYSSFVSFSGGASLLLSLGRCIWLLLSFWCLQGFLTS